LLLLKVCKKNEVLFFFSTPSSFSPPFFGGLVRCVLDMNEIIKKKERKKSKKKLSRQLLLEQF